MDKFVKKIKAASGAMAHIMKNDEPTNKENPYWWKTVKFVDGLQSESMCWFSKSEHAETHFNDHAG